MPVANARPIELSLFLFYILWHYRAAIVRGLYGLLWDWLDCMSRENNFFACDSCEWSNTNYNECLCPLPWCPVSHFLFLSAVWDDLDW